MLKMVPGLGNPLTAVTSLGSSSPSSSSTCPLLVAVSAVCCDRCTTPFTRHLEMFLVTLAMACIVPPGVTWPAVVRNTSYHHTTLHSLGRCCCDCEVVVAGQVSIPTPHHHYFPGSSFHRFFLW